MVVSYVAALRRLAFVERDRDEWIDHARQHALGLIDKIEERASGGTDLTEAQLATIAGGRSMIDEAAAEALEWSAGAEQ